MIEGYISAHPGAVEVTTNPADPDRFHFEYISNNEDIATITKYTGVISAIKTGKASITVKLKRGDRDVCSYPYELSVLDLTPSTPDMSTPEICIVFANGKKGYDVSVGDNNVQIHGQIIKRGDGINVTNNQNGYHYEYTSANTDIATIEQDGTITPKKEGDVDISAVLKYGNTVVSNTYTYMLHVFPNDEGLTWQRDNQYYYYHDSNHRNDWDMGTSWNSSTRAPQTYDWKPTDSLKANTVIAANTWNYANDIDRGNWKQIAWFKTDKYQSWRAICQKIELVAKVPKYSKLTADYRFAANLTLGVPEGTGGCRFGFELKDLGVVTSSDADTKIKDIIWKTYSNNTTYSTPTELKTLIKGTRTTNGSYVEVWGMRSTAPKWEINNKDGDASMSETRYLVAMTHLDKDKKLSAVTSFGYKDIPTYTYYSHIYYHKNTYDGEGYYKDEELYSEGKTGTMKMNKFSAPTRKGYTFLGWSTNPEATVAEYEYQGEFCSYDDVNGGGKGPVYLYAVWRPIPYTVTLNHNYPPYETEEIFAYYGQPMPEDESIVAPTRTGYDFTGYRTQKDITPQVFYYDAEMKSAHIYDKTSDYTIFANWEAHTTKIAFDFQGGNGSTTEVTATYGEAMPTATAPSRTGYTFAGYYYYSEANGQGTKYYNADMTSVRTWNVDEPEVTLHAKWIGNTYAVTLDPQGGTGGSTSVTATYGQPLPSGLTAPTKPGYEFRGYYGIENSDWEESQGNDIYYGGKQYYDKDMNGVEPWDKTDGGTIFAHWAPATYIVTLDANGGVLPINVVDENKQNFDIAEGSNGVITITYKYKTGKANTLVHAEAKKPGYELLGWFVGDVKVIDASETSRNCVITDNGGYWTENGLKYNHAGDLTLTAQYRKKYKYADNVITFGKDENGNPEKVEPDEDWLYSVVNDLVGAAKDVYDHEAGHPQTMVFDLRESINRWTSGGYNCQLVMEDLLKSENSEFISPNVLVYFNSGSYNADKCNNAILSDYTCPNLYVADRYQMKIPYAFNAGKATYERNKLQIDTDDPMWQQSHKSIWGTLCLPFPIKNNNTYKDVSKVIFYELRKHSGSVMQYYKLPEDAVIPANTPVLYERTVGISSAVTIEENAKDINNKNTWIQVPENPDITAVVKSYADAPEPSIHDWEFRGNLKTRVFYGANYVGTPEEADAEIVNNGDIYYFKENKFTHLTPTMTKMVNGQEKWYNAGKMTIYPYRAYFYKKGTGGSAKIASYSILVVDEFGNTTDITNTVFGDGEGDGKIYDLNGIRVMQPVKGRLYIVNGQKKVYR